MAVTSRPVRLRPPAFVKVLGAFLALFNLVAAVFVIWGLSLAYRHYQQRAEVQTLNLAKLLEGNLNSTAQQIDLMLQALVDEAQHDSRGKRLDALIQAQLGRSPLLRLIQVTDAEGRVLYGGSAEGTPGVGDQEFFLHLKGSPGAGLFISRPFQDRANRAWNLAFARRLDLPPGGFGGVVVGYLPLDQLTRILAQVNIGRAGSVSLRSGDLALLARYPGLAGLSSMIGQTEIAGEYLEAVRSGRPMVQFHARSRLDGQRRTYTFVRIAGLGHYILVGLGEADYLLPWRHQIVFSVLALLSLLSLSVAIGWLAWSFWARHLDDQARLAREEAKFRLLAENALDVVWSLGPDGSLAYISPSLTRQRGWTPEEFAALDPSVRAISGNYANVIQDRIDLVRQLPPGSQPFERDLLQVPVRCKDGRTIEVEAQWRVVWGEDGRLLGFQGVTRDITERKRMEAERDHLIENLTQALAEVKVLSGMLPICSHCKKVRDDRGYWNQIEAYLSAHTEATFTHGLCPDCAQAFRDEIQASLPPRPGEEGP